MEIDIKTMERLSQIKNEIFKKNIFDNERKLIVSSVYLKKRAHLKNSELSTMVWQYYKSRNKINVNDIIEKYGRNNLIINYVL